MGEVLAKYMERRRLLQRLGADNGVGSGHRSILWHGVRHLYGCGRHQEAGTECKARMKTFGARVVEVNEGLATLKEAVDAIPRVHEGI